MDKDTLKNLAFTLGVTMQQPYMICWAILKQLYENLNTTCLKNQINFFFQASIDDLQGKYVAAIDNNTPCGYFTSGT